MKAALAIGLVCLAVVGSGCDAVIGELRAGIVASQNDTFNAISDDSGAHPGGTVRTTVCCPTDFVFKVTCLNVVRNRATIGTDVPHAPGDPSTGELWYVEDNPGKDADKLQRVFAASPPTTCPAPPTTITNTDEPTTGDVHVIDNFHN